MEATLRIRQLTGKDKYFVNTAIEVNCGTRAVQRWMTAASKTSFPGGRCCLKLTCAVDLNEKDPVFNHGL